MESYLSVVPAEMGDKTQPPISLAVQYHNLLDAVMETALGMLVSNGIGVIISVVM